MKQVVTIAALALILTGCTSVAPYQAPSAGEPSANLTIALGNEFGKTEVSYGRTQQQQKGCYEFPLLHAHGSARYGADDKPVLKEVTIPAGTPQILRYHRETGASSYTKSCNINIQFVPEQGHRYVLSSDNRYIKSDSDLPWFFGGGPKEECVIRLHELGPADVIKPVSVKKLNTKPVNGFNFRGCSRFAE